MNNNNQKGGLQFRNRSRGSTQFCFPPEGIQFFSRNLFYFHFHIFGLDVSTFMPALVTFITYRFAVKKFFTPPQNNNNASKYTSTGGWVPLNPNTLTLISLEAASACKQVRRNPDIYISANDWGVANSFILIGFHN